MTHDESSDALRSKQTEAEGLEIQKLWRLTKIFSSLS